MPSAKGKGGSKGSACAIRGWCRTISVGMGVAEDGVKRIGVVGIAR